MSVEPRESFRLPWWAKPYWGGVWPAASVRSMREHYAFSIAGDVAAGREPWEVEVAAFAAFDRAWRWLS